MPALSPATQSQLAQFAAVPLGYISTRTGLSYEVRTPVTQFTPVKGDDAATLAAAVQAAQDSQFGQSYAALSAGSDHFIAPAYTAMAGGNGIVTPLVAPNGSTAVSLAVQGMLGLGTPAGPLASDHTPSDVL